MNPSTSGIQPIVFSIGQFFAGIRENTDCSQAKSSWGDIRILHYSLKVQGIVESL